MEEQMRLLQEWQQRIRKSQKAHYQDAERLKRNKLYLGIPTVILTSLVSAGVFTSMNDSGDTIQVNPLFIGLISVLATILVSLQTFLNYAENKEKHLNAARRLSSLKKEVQQNIITIEKTTETLNVFIEEVRLKWEEIINEAPLISSANFDRFFRKKNTTKNKNQRQL
ncbi:SLATT domain-containing protein [Aquimarina sp. 2201CG14-23]|uniref:SLATT domain-containing protein n=1 Tax=Aquimarina mycalae TaxID=3040073 RepID=UPI0024780CAD|nr:SLATT domain-containing protein [Aquimarina sp. 2201CG14-23]MDH7445653.1 SLATT domain-containing protein [Aquimarina sp. 2201CG14-23]